MFDVEKRLFFDFLVNISSSENSVTEYCCATNSNDNCVANSIRNVITDRHLWKAEIIYKEFQKLIFSLRYHCGQQKRLRTHCSTDFFTFLLQSQILCLHFLTFSSRLSKTFDLHSGKEYRLWLWQQGKFFFAFFYSDEFVFGCEFHSSCCAVSKRKKKPLNESSWWVTLSNSIKKFRFKFW